MRRLDPTQPTSTKWLIGTVAGAASYVVASSRALPERVASHFDARGVADVFVARDRYVSGMLLATIASPLAIFLIVRQMRRLPAGWINLPNKGYWLAPSRSATTYAWIEAHAGWLGVLLTLFLAFVHSRVVAANALDPPALGSMPFAIGLIFFLAAVFVWAGALNARFRRSAHVRMQR